VRERAVLGGDPSLAYFEYSAAPGADLDDPVSVAAANPALGIRITPEFVGRERAALSESDFARERLGLWENPGGAAVIDPLVWGALADRQSQTAGRVSFAVDATPDRTSASVAIAGRRADGRWHVEVVDNGRGLVWLVPRLAELVERWAPAAVALDPSGPVGSLLPALRETGHAVLGDGLTLVSAREMGQACGAFHDDVVEGRLRHLDQPLLNAALGAARKRPLGDAWAWHRRDLTDISPLVAVTLARHAHATAPEDEPRYRRVTGKVRGY
jgi:phage terminase large subunit-like protein